MSHGRLSAARVYQVLEVGDVGGFLGIRWWIDCPVKHMDFIVLLTPNVFA